MIAKNVWDPIIVIVIHIIILNGFTTSCGVMLQMCGRRLSQGKAPTENMKTNFKFDRTKIVYAPAHFWIVQASKQMHIVGLYWITNNLFEGGQKSKMWRRYRGSYLPKDLHGLDKYVKQHRVNDKKELYSCDS